ncbi:MAG: TetR/AcrR family transcriptional regulator C-terminal domain-containing protein [Chloroflexi bacterium]|nr:TetR/AcrR family transcriptional regulator C-terminal domain-containing protein [Chloroflexota bacterium]
MTTKEDRRSQRTRRLIGNALVELMLEKRFEDITVQDILDRADVGRSTFYAHYRDKESLLLSEIERVIQQLDAYASEVRGAPFSLLPSLELFRHVQEHRRLMQAFVWGRGAEALTHEFQMRVAKIIERNLVTRVGEAKPTAVPLPVMASFVATTFLMLLRWWFDEQMRHTPEEVDGMFQALVLPAFSALEHIRQHSTGHSEVILTETPAHADRFVAEVDSSAVFVNASARFNDGSQHAEAARAGPMALEELTTYKRMVMGDEHVRP